MSAQNASPEKILEVIKKAKKVVTPMDSRFDYDSLCSTLALKLVLIQLGKQYDVYFEQQLPKNSSQFFDFSYVIENTYPNNIDYSMYDLIVTLDTGDLAHLSESQNVILPADIVKIKIDHHTTNKNGDFANFQYCNTSSASTTCVLYDLFKVWGIDFTTDIANALMLGLITDSGRFQYINTGAPELRMAADLIEKGANYYDLNHKLLFNESYAGQKYKALIYSNLKIDTSKKFAYSYHTNSDLVKYGLSENDKSLPTASDLIKYISGIDFAFVIKEIPNKPGSFKASLRSHEPNFDVSRLASEFGGGGHVMASATGELMGVKNIEEAVKLIAKKAEEIKESLWI